MTKQIVWVVEKGEKHEGGTVIAVMERRTHARCVKRDVQRDEWFDHEVDYCRISKWPVGSVVPSYLLCVTGRSLENMMGVIDALVEGVEV